MVLYSTTKPYLEPWSIKDVVLYSTTKPYLEPWSIKDVVLYSATKPYLEPWSIKDVVLYSATKPYRLKIKRCCGKNGSFKDSMSRIFNNNIINRML